MVRNVTDEDDMGSASIAKQKEKKREEAIVVLCLRFHNPYTQRHT